MGYNGLRRNEWRNGGCHSMLAFIDESGHPHPNDPNERAVIVASCIEESDARKIAGAVHALKRDTLQRERMELKGRSLLNRRTFRKKSDYALFLEEFFSALLDMPIVIFAIVIERPDSIQEAESDFLPRQFQFLVERIQLLADERGQMATILFDGDGGLFGGLSQKFNSFLYRSQLGQSWNRITDAPFFVDSKTSVGIQIADMAASAARHYYEAELHHRQPPADDLFLLAIRRYYRIIERKTVNLTSLEGFDRYGIYRMPARADGGA